MKNSNKLKSYIAIVGAVLLAGIIGIIIATATNNDAPETYNRISPAIEEISSEIESEIISEEVIEEKSSSSEVEEISSENESENSEVQYLFETEELSEEPEVNYEYIEEEPIEEVEEEEVPEEEVSSEESQPDVSSEEPTQTSEINEDDWDLLARIIYQEAGCTWLSDEHQLLVGAVVMNRVKSPYFPNTVYDVIYQPGQYGPAIYGTLYSATPDERTYENARKVLAGEFYCPENVVWQSGEVQGDGIYVSIYDELLGTTTYFCYSNWD